MTCKIPSTLRAIRKVLYEYFTSTLRIFRQFVKYFTRGRSEVFYEYFTAVKTAGVVLYGDSPPLKGGIVKYP
jgi:hypothetical protein